MESNRQHLVDLAAEVTSCKAFFSKMSTTCSLGTFKHEPGVRCQVNISKHPPQKQKSVGILPVFPLFILSVLSPHSSLLSACFFVFPRIRTTHIHNRLHQRAADEEGGQRGYHARATYATNVIKSRLLNARQCWIL